MKISVLFFGVLKDLVGRPAEKIDLPEGTRVQDLVLYYAQASSHFEAMLPSLALTVNRECSGVNQTLCDGDEVGLLPPVSGGSAEDTKTAGEVKLVRERIDAELVVQSLKRPKDGAIVVFDGIVRNNTRGRPTFYLRSDER